MYLKKLLILFYSLVKHVILLVIVSGLLTACISVLTPEKNITNKFFINTIQENYGMLLNNKLGALYNNSNVNIADYIVNISIKQSSGLSLTSISGFATKNTLYFTAYVNIINKANNQNVYSFTVKTNEVYNIENNAIAISSNKELATQYAIQTIANQISTQINLFIKKQYENIR